MLSAVIRQKQFYGGFDRSVLPLKGLHIDRNTRKLIYHPGKMGNECLIPTGGAGNQNAVSFGYISFYKRTEKLGDLCRIQGINIFQEEGIVLVTEGRLVVPNQEIPGLPVDQLEIDEYKGILVNWLLRYIISAMWFFPSEMMEYAGKSNKKALE